MLKKIRKSRAFLRQALGWAVLLTLAAGVGAAGAGPGQGAPLNPAYKKWLEEEVVYIITPLEREVFSKLQSDRERDLFIEAFWKHREAAASGETSFRAEHYRRIAHANRYYGRTTPLPGWKTDRGRMYIILGEPTSVEKYDTKADLYPTEVWFYQNKERLGLPGGFYLVFFQERGSGDFKLYSPAKDGPQALMPNFSGDTLDYARAYQTLREIAPELASISMSLIPGESSASLGRPTLSSDILLKKVEESPRREVEEAYARKFLDYRGIVDVEYSANYLDSETLVKVLKAPGGPYFVHYAIEPSRLSIEQIGDKYVGTLKINGSVSEPAGRVVYQFDKAASLTMTPDQVREAGRMKFDFHDMFPLIAGTYKVSILVRNEVSKEFTSLEQTVLIPGEAPGLQMTSPILAYRTAKADGPAKRLKPFRLGSVQLYVQPNRAFARSETLAVGFQLFGLSEAQKAGGRIRFTLTKDGQTFQSREKGVLEYPALPDLVEEFPLGDFPPAHYLLTVACLLDGREAVSAKEEFDVSQLAALPRPWFYSKILPEISDPLYGSIIGGQLGAAGRAGEARAILEKSLAANPGSPDTAVALARVLTAMKDDARVPELLEPFLHAPAAPKYEIFILAGEARLKTGQAAAALDLFDRAAAQFGVNAELLKDSGEAHLALGQIPQALAAWEQSLKINPAQPELRQKWEALKAKK